jgi:hypothetical protein
MFDQKPEKVQEVSGFADRGMDKLRSLLETKAPTTASTDRVEGPKESKEAAPVRSEEPRTPKAVAPRPVEDRVTLGQEDNDDTGMNWLNNLTANYG